LKVTGTPIISRQGEVMPILKVRESIHKGGVQNGPGGRYSSGPRGGDKEKNFLHVDNSR